MAVDTTKNLTQTAPESFLRANVDNAPMYASTEDNLRRDIYDPAKGYTTAQYAPEIFNTATDIAQQKQGNADMATMLASPTQKIENDVNAMQDTFLAQENAKTNEVPTSTALTGEIVNAPSPAPAEKTASMAVLEKAQASLVEQRDAYAKLEANKGSRPTMNFEQAYRGLMEEQGYTADQNKLTGVQKDIADAEARLRDRVQAQYADGEIPMGVVAGRIGEIERQDMQRIDYLRRQETDLVNRLNQKSNVINTIMKYKSTDFDNAVKTYEDNYKNALDGIKNYGSMSTAILDIEYKVAQEGEKMAEMKDKKKADEAKQMLEIYKQDQLDKAKNRDDARANLQILYNNVITGGVDVSALSADEKKDWAKLELQANLPVGTFQNLQAKNNGFEMKGQGTERFNEKGEKLMDFVMYNPRTGEIKVEQQNLGYDASAALEQRNKLSMIADRAGNGSVSVGSFSPNDALRDVIGVDAATGAQGVRALNATLPQGVKSNCVYFARSINPDLPTSLYTLQNKVDILLNGKPNRNEWGTPAVGDVAVVQTGDTPGHLATVASVDSEGNPTFVESNWVAGTVGMRGTNKNSDSIVGYWRSPNSDKYIGKILSQPVVKTPELTPTEKLSEIDSAFKQLSGTPGQRALSDLQWPVAGKYMDPKEYNKIRDAAVLDEKISGKEFDAHFSQYRDPLKVLEYTLSN